MSAPANQADAAVERTLRRLAVVWTEFEGRLGRTPLLRRLDRAEMTLADYQALLVNLRQQVVDGALWMARAASNVDEAHFDLRSRLIGHAQTEHRDYKLLDGDYVATGGEAEVILRAAKNVGSEALSAWMFHEASKPNPFGLLGAMFVIEGLGSLKAADWGRRIMAQLGIGKEAVRFLLYHGENDSEHMKEFDEMLRLVLPDPFVEDRIVRCAEVTGRLYALQIECVS